MNTIHLRDRVRIVFVQLRINESDVAMTSLVLLLWIAPWIAFGDEFAPLAIVDGSRFRATDTLECGEETNTDAKECLAKLSWPKVEFTVHLEAAERGCGDYLVRFPSPRPIGNSTNDLVSMEWFAARDTENSIRKAPAIVVVHESGSRMTVGRLIARGLSVHGLHAFLLHLPGYGARDDGAVSGINHILPSLQQAIADARRARDAVVALPVIDSSVVGVQGTSLGGFVTATVAGLDHGYDRVFILLAGGDLQYVLLHGSNDAAKARKKLAAAGVNEKQIKELVRPVEPLRLAHRINPDETWIYSGKFDNVVPPRCSQALAKAARLPDGHHIELSADHYSGIVYLPQVVQQIYRRMVHPVKQRRSNDSAHMAPNSKPAQD